MLSALISPTLKRTLSQASPSIKSSPPLPSIISLPPPPKMMLPEEKDVTPSPNRLCKPLIKAIWAGLFKAWFKPTLVRLSPLKISSRLPPDKPSTKSNRSRKSFTVGGSKPVINISALAGCGSFLYITQSKPNIPSLRSIPESASIISSPDSAS